MQKSTTTLVTMFTFAFASCMVHPFSQRLSNFDLFNPRIYASSDGSMGALSYGKQPEFSKQPSSINWTIRVFKPDDDGDVKTIGTFQIDHIPESVVLDDKALFCVSVNSLNPKVLITYINMKTGKKRIWGRLQTFTQLSSLGITFPSHKWNRLHHIRLLDSVRLECIDDKQRSITFNASSGKIEVNGQFGL